MNSIEKGSKRTSRHDLPSTIEYLVDSPEAAYSAVTINISTSGIAAYVFSRHPEGQKIIIKNPLPIDCRVATVHWTKKEEESFYLAGLKFIDHFPGFWPAISSNYPRLTGAVTRDRISLMLN